MTRRIVVTDHTFGALPAAERVALQEGAGLEVHQARTVRDTIACAVGADVVLVQYAPITRAVLACLGSRATVIRYGIGYDNIDTAAAAEFGVQVAYVPDYGVDTVADHAVALILGAFRKVSQFDRAVRRDQSWVEAASLGPIRALSDSTVGLVGTGRIGSAVATRLMAFGCTIIAHDPYADAAAMAAAGIQMVSFSDLLARSDAVSLHAPLTAETAGIVGAAALAAMRPEAVLVNTARGGLVDTDALAAALARGEIAGAALDVVDPEPLPVSSPLWDAPNLTLTPHVSFYSTASLAKLERLAAEEAGRALRGEPLRCPVR